MHSYAVKKYIVLIVFALPMKWYRCFLQRLGGSSFARPKIACYMRYPYINIKLFMYVIPP